MAVLPALLPFLLGDEFEFGEASGTVSVLREPRVAVVAPVSRAIVVTTDPRIAAAAAGARIAAVAVESRTVLIASATRRVSE